MGAVAALFNGLLAADALLFECAEVEKRVTDFLTCARTGKIDRLQKEHETLWKLCRDAEDRHGEAQDLEATLSARLTVLAGALSTAKQRVIDTESNPPFRSRFPTATARAPFERACRREPGGESRSEPGAPRQKRALGARTSANGLFP